MCSLYRGDSNFVNSEFTSALTFKHGLWCRDQTLVVLKVANLQQECMREMHDTPWSCHMGVTKTTKAIMWLFRWPAVQQDVKQYVLTCHSCQRTCQAVCVTCDGCQRARVVIRNGHTPWCQCRSHQSTMSVSI